MPADPSRPSDGPKIFVSYRRGRTNPYARSVHDRLVERFGKERVFLDVDDIRPGADFTKVIESELETCDVLLAVVGPDWLARRCLIGRRRLDNPADFVHIELRAALTTDTPVIPILVDNADMPAPRQLPPTLASFAHKHAVELSDRRWSADMETLIKTIEQIPRESAENVDPASATGRQGTDHISSGCPGSGPEPQPYPGGFLALAGILLVFAALRFAILARTLTGVDQVADAVAAAAVGVVGLVLLLPPARSGAAWEGAAGVFLGVSPFVTVRMWWSAQLRGAVPPVILESPLWMILAALGIVVFLVARSPCGFGRPQLRENAAFASGVAATVGLVAIGWVLPMSDDLATLRLSDPILLLASAVLAVLAITTQGVLQGAVLVGWAAGLCGVAANTVWLLRHTEFGLPGRILSTHLALSFLAVIVLVTTVALRRRAAPTG